MHESALLVIDLQQEFARRTAAGLPRSNPQAEGCIAALVARFRAGGLPVVHVHHDDPSPASGFRLGMPGGAPMPCAAPIEGEPVFVKRGSSAFIGTDLETCLRGQGLTRLIVIGAAINFCVASTVRGAANLGFDVTVVQDAVFGFGITGPDGRAHDPETVLSVTLATLSAGFAAARPSAGLFAS
jgi:nicotinamidase-related amidase